MDSVYQDVIPPLIENTTMRLRIKDGLPYTYRIAPVDGYVLHDTARDWDATDPITGKTTHYQGFSHGTSSCAASYDFSANPREFFAVPYNGETYGKTVVLPADADASAWREVTEEELPKEEVPEME